MGRCGLDCAEDRLYRPHAVEVGAAPGDRQRHARRSIKALERENKELRRANEILKSASAFFAQAALERELKK